MAKKTAQTEETNGFIIEIVNLSKGKITKDFLTFDEIENEYNSRLYDFFKLFNEITRGTGNRYRVTIGTAVEFCDGGKLGKEAQRKLSEKLMETSLRLRSNKKLAKEQFQTIEFNENNFAQLTQKRTVQQIESDKEYLKLIEKK